MSQQVWPTNCSQLLSTAPLEYIAIPIISAKDHSKRGALLEPSPSSAGPSLSCILTGTSLFLLCWMVSFPTHLR